MGSQPFSNEACWSPAWVLVPTATSPRTATSIRRRLHPKGPGPKSDAPRQRPVKEPTPGGFEGFIRKARRACGYEVPKTETYQDPFSDQCYHERKLIWRQHRTPTEKPLVTLVTKNDLRISGDPPKRVRESNRD